MQCHFCYIVIKSRYVCEKYVLDYNDYLFVFIDKLKFLGLVFDI